MKLTVTQVVTEVTKGGSAVMTKAAAAKYKTVMPAFKGRLTQAQIADLAAFVYRDRNQAPVCQVVSSSGCVTTTGGLGTSHAGGSGNVGAGNGNDNGCPPGVTIVQNGNVDADEDDTGGHDDGDGCV